MKLKSNTRWVIPTAVIIIALIARIVPGPRTIDDSYITFRYARNILAGNGFVYNPGERVLGTTTPLYTILLVLLSQLTGGVNAPFPVIAWLVNSCIDAVTCLLLYKLGRKLGYPFAGLGAALVWSIAPYSVTFAIGGLETSVYIFLIVAAIYSYIDENHYLTALFSALSFLTRPDALIFIGLILLDQILSQLSSFKSASGSSIRKNLFWEIIIFTIPTLSWIIFAWIYFGNPLPHSIAAKSVAYRLPPNTAIVRLLQHYATPFLDHLTFGISWIGVGLVMYPFLFLVGSRRAYQSNPHILPFLLYPWLYFTIYAIANPLIFRWYLSPPLPAYMLIILVGLESLLDRIGTTFYEWLSRKKLIIQPKFGRQAWFVLSVFLISVFPAGMSLRNWTLHPDHGLDRPAPSMAWYKLELLYQDAALELAPVINARPYQLQLAAGDVGVLGYFTQARILDTVGLNSPQTLKYYPLDQKYYVINYAIPPNLILDNLPDFVVILEVYGREGLLKDSRFQESYQLITKLDTNIYGSDGMLVFERHQP
jgi:hypothetical protein